jgi:hypothetical protein
MSLELTAPTLIGLLCAEARVERLPAQLWPLQIALEHIAVTHEDSAVKRACARWPRASGGSAAHFQVKKIMRELARGGFFSPEGRGWDAGYAPDSRWLRKHAMMWASLSGIDRLVLRQAAQRLRATLTTWSKNAVASRPVGAAIT